jgi:hypothetical protein
MKRYSYLDGLVFLLNVPGRGVVSRRLVGSVLRHGGFRVQAVGGAELLQDRLPQLDELVNVEKVLGVVLVHEGLHAGEGGEHQNVLNT